MRIALVGFGKMGHVVYTLATQLGHTVVSIIDPHSHDSLVTDKTLTVESLGNAEIVIEFSHHEGIKERLHTYQEGHIPCVIATTGWYDLLPEITDTYKESSTAILWSGNFALGVHLFFSIVRSASRIMNSFSDYDVVVQELFHAKKGDSPSGTSHMIGSILTEELSHKESVVTSRLDRKREESEIHIASARGGSNPGVHSVIFDSNEDSIEITHRARSREGFAKGALQAGSWLLTQQGGFYTLNDMMKELIEI
ncbi:MAG: 4-hydroxy-tetrahydrodipicolinate reductase [Spirochaetia bacterium]|nr:4-hydroxy-tetrahydrodipicolinate reductase [Spirochaetia bacterium]